MQLLIKLLFPSLIGLTTAWPLLLTPWEQIHQTLHTYPLALDSKTFSLLSQIFTTNATADYTPTGLGVLHGLTNISSALEGGLTTVHSQHQLGTTVIDVHDGGSSANSTTYYTVGLFGTGSAQGQYVFLHGQYKDSLVKGNNGWRIHRRVLLLMGPPVGNASLLG